MSDALQIAAVQETEQQLQFIWRQKTAACPSAQKAGFPHISCKAEVRHQPPPVNHTRGLKQFSVPDSGAKTSAGDSAPDFTLGDSVFVNATFAEGLR